MVRAGQYGNNYRLSWYAIMMITVNYHGDITVITFLLVYSVHF